MTIPFIEKPLFHFVSIVLLGLLGYSNTFHSPFFFDDSTNIFWNPIIKDLDNFFLSTEAYRYNPRRFVGYLSFALNYKLGGNDAFGYHAVNLCIHIVNALLVYLLVTLTVRAPFFTNLSSVRQEKDRQPAPPAAFLAGLLFVSHPLATQSVTYIVQRYTSLATLFYLLSLVCYIKARLTLCRTRLNMSAGIFFALSFLTAVLGMKTKEIAFTLPFVILLYEFSFFGGGAFRKKLVFLLPLLLLLAVIPLSVVNMERSPGELLTEIDAGTRIDTSLPRWDYFVTQLRVIVTYIRLIFLPINQNLDYDYPPVHSLLSPGVVASFLLIASLAGAGLYFYRLSRTDFSFLRLTGFGILWFFITLSVESSLIPIADVIFEHRTYLPSVGAFAAIAGCFSLAFCRGVSRKTGYLLMLTVALLLTGATFARNRVWQSEISMWEDVARKSPGKARAHNNLGAAYLAEGFAEKATSEFEAALAIDPGNSEACSNLAMAYSAKGQKQEALIFFEKAVEADPANGLALSNLGSLYEEMGALEKAKEYYLAAVRAKPALFQARKNLGGVYLKQGELDPAVRELKSALELNPDSAGVLYNLGIAFLQKENIDEAIIHLEKAVTLQPDYSEAHNNLGVAYIIKGNPAQALIHFRTAVEQDPLNVTAGNNFNKAKSLLQR